MASSEPSAQGGLLLGRYLQRTGVEPPSVAGVVGDEQDHLRPIADLNGQVDKASQYLQHHKRVPVTPEEQRGRWLDGLETEGYGTA